MRQMRRRIAAAIGILVFAGVATVASGQPSAAQRGPQADTGGSFLPGFRLPPDLKRAIQEREAARTARARPTRQARPLRNSRQAVRMQSARSVHNATVYRAHVARVVEEPSTVNRSRSSVLVAEARRYIGTNPTGRARLWCARFVNFVLKKVGQPGTGSDAARSFAMYGRRISGPQVGAIAVLTRKGGGHVGIVTGVDRHGNPILIAGNNGRRKVGISVYSKRRVIAYVMPDGTGVRKSRYARR